MKFLWVIHECTRLEKMENSVVPSRSIFVLPSHFYLRNATRKSIVFNFTLFWRSAFFRIFWLPTFFFLFFSFSYSSTHLNIYKFCFFHRIIIVRLLYVLNNLWYCFVFPFFLFVLFYFNFALLIFVNRLAYVPVVSFLITTYYL